MLTDFINRYYHFYLVDSNQYTAKDLNLSRLLIKRCIHSNIPYILILCLIIPGYAHYEFKYIANDCEWYVIEQLSNTLLSI